MSRAPGLAPETRGIAGFPEPVATRACHNSYGGGRQGCLNALNRAADGTFRHVQIFSILALVEP
jgi:hypothetical protein